jgi:hypothetical protein
MTLLSFAPSELPTGMIHDDDEHGGPKRKPFYMYLPLLGKRLAPPTHSTNTSNNNNDNHHRHCLPLTRPTPLAPPRPRAAPLPDPTRPPPLPHAPLHHLRTQLLHPLCPPRLRRAGSRARRL